MALHIALRPSLSLPRVAQAKDNEPRHDFHWVGQKRNTLRGNAGQGDQNNNSQEKQNKQNYRPLESITLGEVDDAIKLFEHQLVPSQENWVGKNHFCTIPLKRKQDGRPPVIFGRVKTCYPSDGYIQNIEDIELFFPRKVGAPETLLVRKEDISQHGQIATQSFHIRVAFKMLEEDQADFEGTNSLFAPNGFIPEFDSGYYDLLEMNEQNQSIYPWLYVVSSRWFDSVPDSLHMEMNAKLQAMNHWDKHIFNYHPDWLPKEINSLNRILGLKYEFTSVVLTEPANPQETAYIVAKRFNEVFEQGFQPKE